MGASKPGLRGITIPMYVLSSSDRPRKRVALSEITSNSGGEAVITSPPLGVSSATVIYVNIIAVWEFSQGKVRIEGFGTERPTN